MTSLEGEHKFAKADVLLISAFCAPLAFAGIWLIQRLSNESEAWDSGSFWPFVLISALILGGLFARHDRPRSSFIVAGIFTGLVIISGVALSDDRAGGTFFLTFVILGPLLTLLLGGVAAIGGFMGEKLGRST